MQPESMSFTSPSPAARTILDVDDVQPATKPLDEKPYRACLGDRLRPPPLLPRFRSEEATIDLEESSIEACADHSASLVPCDMHPALSAVHQAFCEHRPLD